MKKHVWRDSSVARFWPESSSAQDAKAGHRDARRRSASIPSRQSSTPRPGSIRARQAPTGVAVPKFIEKSYTRAIHFETPRLARDRVRVQARIRRTAAASSRSSASSGNQTIIVNADTPWVQQLEIWMMPTDSAGGGREERDGRSETVGGRNITS